MQVTMQAVPQQPPVPLRWVEACRNVEAAQTALDGLIQQLDSALYLDDEAWQQAVPHAQFAAALQVRGWCGKGSKGKEEQRGRSC